MRKIDIYTLDKKNVFRNSNITSGISASHPLTNKGTNPTLKAESSSLPISFQFSIHSTCLSLFCFVCVHMNRSGFGILIFVSRSVTLFRIVHILFSTASTSHCSISITFRCASSIVYTSMVCCTFNCALWIIVATPLWGKCEDETHTPESGNLESSRTPATSARLQKSKHLALRCSLYRWKGLKA